jgi:hypothetical protein
MLTPRLEAVIRPNSVSMRNLETGQVASADAPFSCSHLLVDDPDIFEHALRMTLKKVVRGGFSFPRVTVSTAGRPVHRIEQKLICDGLLNAGASRAILAETVTSFDEQTAARSAYIERAKQKR